MHEEKKLQDELARLKYVADSYYQLQYERDKGLKFIITKKEYDEYQKLLLGRPPWNESYFDMVIIWYYIFFGLFLILCFVYILFDNLLPIFTIDPVSIFFMLICNGIYISHRKSFERFQGLRIGATITSLIFSILVYHYGVTLVQVTHGDGSYAYKPRSVEVRLTAACWTFFINIITLLSLEFGNIIYSKKDNDKKNDKRHTF
jgi:hypothetical protein